MTDIFSALGNFGFPIVVSIYLLVRFENKIEKLTDAIQDNNTTTKDLVKVISDLSKK